MYYNVNHSCDAKLNFKHHYSSLQCHKVLSEIILICAQETIIIAENSCAVTVSTKKKKKWLGHPLLMNRFDYFSNFYEYKS